MYIESKSKSGKRFLVGALLKTSCLPSTVGEAEDEEEEEDEEVLVVSLCSTSRYLKPLAKLNGVKWSC